MDGIPRAVEPTRYDARDGRVSRLNQALACVGIVAGGLFIVAVIFFSGFFLNWSSGGHWDGDMGPGPSARCGQMGPGGRMGPGGPGRGGMMGPGGPIDCCSQMGPGGMRPGGMMGPGGLMGPGPH